MKIDKDLVRALERMSAVLDEGTGDLQVHFDVVNSLHALHERRVVLHDSIEQPPGGGVGFGCFLV